jgi:hypothetical protein
MTKKHLNPKDLEPIDNYIGLIVMEIERIVDSLEPKDHDEKSKLVQGVMLGTIQKLCNSTLSRVASDFPSIVGL